MGETNVDIRNASIRVQVLLRLELF